MGRKLSPSERGVFTDDGALDPRQAANDAASRNLERQRQIAQALGLPIAALSPHDDIRNQALAEVDQTRAAEVAMNRDCLDLIRAYTRIADPEERQRLLAIVRAAADGP